MCATGHALLDQINFRDYLIAHPESAKQYEELKTELAIKYRNDREGYRLAKNDFIPETLSLARKQSHE